MAALDKASIATSRAKKDIKKRMFLISVILIIFISSFSTINAQQIDENQTDNLELEISTIPGDNLQELPSSSNLSTNPDTNSKKAFFGFG